MVAGVAWLTYYHATQNHVIFNHVRGRAMAFAFILYVGPILAGATVVVAMLKPFFAPRGREAPFRRLKPESEPALFGYVDQLCDLVGSPAPTEIRVDCAVNASAGFPRGFFSMLGGDLILTIGLPLAAGLKLNQFTGVLAHEFGHFTQGFTIRVNGVTMSILRWFGHAVYYRDGWDESLIDMTRTDNGLVNLTGWLVNTLIWMVRGVLWLCLQAGLLVSMALVRQTEFDADAYEYGVVGTETFSKTMKKLPLLAYGDQIALAVVVHQAPSFGSLPENLPALVAELAAEPSEQMKKLRKKNRKAETKAFDTHPADKDRIAAAEDADAPGLFTSELPASVLFSNFDALCQNATFDHYREMLSKKIDRASLEPNEKFLATARQIAGHAPPLPT
ncbi:MAG: M48 family metalloprotease, partial [Planctomycetia bacterium]